MTPQHFALSATTDFFDSYRDALLARDVDRIAEAYHCPALIAFPGNAIAVTSPQQTQDFFRRAIDQYAGVEAVTSTIELLAATEHSIWADVTWSYGGVPPDERMVYQLLATGDGWRIGVLTPM
ncbi:hypothetical protein [Tsukamurella sp. 1534]|uniref:hypothetical protein n=1 Tax=Tsukamurella sp. 1534 TaxID=1151061 RepID=UPI0002FDFF63|nr:hypothetical protein [Tsukamurella sp. 1534]